MKRTPSPQALIGALGVTLLAVACGSAFAYFTTTGEGNVNAGVSNLSKSTITAATAAVGGTVTLTWSAVTAPSTGTVSYYVSRDGEEAAGTCPTASSPSTVLTCADKGLEPGVHSYVVTAVWRSWTAASAPKTANVTIGAATHLTLSAASTNPTAGSTDNLTIAAKDSNESTVTTYTGSKSLVFSGASASPNATKPVVYNSSGSAINFGSATTVSFTSGVATATGATKNGVMKLSGAEAAEISVTDGTLSSSGLAVLVSPAAFSKLVLTVDSTTPAVGADDDLTITAQDAYANVVTSYEGIKPMIFSGPVASPGGNVPTVTDASGEAIPFGTSTAIEFLAGVASTSGSANGEMRLYKSASASLKVGEGSILSAGVTVVPVVGEAIKFAFSASTTTPVAGASVNLTTTAQDVYGNTVTTYTGIHNLVFSGALASPAGNLPTVAPSSSTTGIAFGTETPINFTNGVASVASSKNGLMKIYRAGPATISVTDGAISATAPIAVVVAPAALSKFVLSVETNTPAVGAPDDLGITAQDTYGNTITTYTGAHNMTFSGASASPGGNLPTVTNAAEEAIAFGTATAIEFSAGVAATAGALNGEMRLYKNAASNVKVTEGSISSATVTVTPTVGATARFGLSASTTAPAAGGNVNLTTTAQDAYGNTTTVYAGIHNLVFSSASVSPAGNTPTVAPTSSTTGIPLGTETPINFTNGVASVASSKNGLLKLYDAEVVSLTVTDGTVSAATPVTIAVSPATASKLALIGVTKSAGSLSATCYFTCTVTGLGNSGTVQAGVAVTDTYGNIVSNIGTGHSVTVSSTGGAVSGGSFTMPSTGPAETSTRFTYTSPASGSFTNTITAAATAGTVYTSATATATK
jgi:hypothetical protein